MDVFEARHYRDFLLDMIERNLHIKGYKARIAENARCQPSYVSQVLRGTAELTPEQAMGLALFWGLSDLESQYFIELVQLARAGTVDLRRYVERRLASLRKERDGIAHTKSVRMTNEHAATLFVRATEWYFTAVHCLMAIPEYRTVPAIAERFRLSTRIVEDVLQVLSEIGLCRHENGEWQVDNVEWTIPRGVGFQEAFLKAWRQKAMINSVIDGAREQSIHQTYLCPVERAALPELRAKVIEFIEAIRTRTENHKAEELVALNVDFFIP